jgi:2'-5' RNA ligase
VGDVAAAVRWTAPDNLHVTLHFIGDIAAARVRDLTSALGDDLDAPSFALTPAEVGVFASRGAARTVWLSVSGGEAEAIEVHQASAERLRRAGVRIEDRPFTPHLTLGRVRDRERRRARGLPPALAGFAVPPIEWRVAHVTLFSSDLSGPRPAYRAIHQIRLRSSPARSGPAVEGR